MSLFKKIARKIRYHINDKFYYNQWTIGIARADIGEIITGKSFNPRITWFPLKNRQENCADPFILKDESGNYDIFYEKYMIDDLQSGDIWVMKVDREFNVISDEVLLDRQFHASFPFLYRENGKVYVVPETANENKLLCYEFDSANRALSFKGSIIDEPLRDATILKHDNKYWLFGMLKFVKGLDEKYESWVYVSDQFTGPYSPHPRNPIKKGLNGTRSAGNFIRVGGDLYRPTQNCEEEYGKSINISRIERLNESEIKEDHHMTISIKRNRYNKGITKIHTINAIDDIIIVDGVKRTFSLSKIFASSKVWINHKFSFIFSLASPAVFDGWAAVCLDFSMI